MEIILICPFENEVSIKTSFDILNIIERKISVRVDKNLFNAFKKIEKILNKCL